MRLHRFFGDFDFSGGNASIMNRDIVSQIKNVLRLKQGDGVILADGHAREAEARITELGRDHIEFELGRIFQNENEPGRDVTLYAALLKRELFELVVQKATEIGVKEIIPILSSRTVKQGLRYERLHKIIREAAEQSGRGIVPELHETISFADTLRASARHQKTFMLHPTGESLSEEGVPKKGSIGLLVGPEGGWEEGEVALAKSAGCVVMSLGKLVLRAETAALVGAYLVIHT